MTVRINEVETNSNGHNFDSLGICINCNGCVKPDCACAGEVCAWIWVGGLPAKKPYKGVVQ